MIDQKDFKGFHIVTGIGSRSIIGRNAEMVVLEHTRAYLKEAANKHNKPVALLSGATKGFDYLLTQLNMPYSLILPHSTWCYSHYGNGWDVEQMLYGAMQLEYLTNDIGNVSTADVAEKHYQRLGALVDEVIVYQKLELYAPQLEMLDYMMVQTEAIITTI